MELPSEIAPILPTRTSPGTIESIQNEGNKTKEEILEECNAVYKEYKRAAIPISNTAELDKFREKIIREHRALYQAYPLVVRHMIDDNMYHHRAFEKYLNIVEKKPWKSEDEQMESYTQYFMILYRELNPKYKPNEMAKIRTDYLGRLKKEGELFKKLFEEKKKEVDEEEQRFIKERKEDTIAKFKIMAEKLNFSEEIVQTIIMKLELDMIDAKYVESLCDVFLRENPIITPSNDEPVPAENTSTENISAEETAPIADLSKILLE